MLAHSRTGTGPPLVLLHGIGLDRATWDPVVPILAREREVIAVDLPGFGESPVARRARPRSRRSPRPSRSSASSARTWPGNSLGGGIALELGRRGWARSVCAISPIGFAAGRERAYARATLQSDPRDGERARRARGDRLRRPGPPHPLAGLVIARPWPGPGSRRRAHEPHHRARPGLGRHAARRHELDARRCRRARPRSPGASTTACCSPPARRRARSAGCPRRAPRPPARLRARADVGRPRAGRARDPRCRRLSAPLLLVDVDGVLSLFGPGVDRGGCTPALVEGIPHFLSRGAAGAARPARRRASSASGARAGRTARTATCPTCSACRPAGRTSPSRPPRGRRPLEAARDRRPRGPRPPRRLDRRRPRRALPGLGRRAARPDAARDDRSGRGPDRGPGRSARGLGGLGAAPAPSVSSSPDGEYLARGRRHHERARRRASPARPGARAAGGHAPAPVDQEPARLRRPRRRRPARATATSSPTPRSRFVAFCLASAGTYLLNDVADLEADRAPPRQAPPPDRRRRDEPRRGHRRGRRGARAGLRASRCSPARRCCSSSPPTSR